MFTPLTANPYRWKSVADAPPQKLAPHWSSTCEMSPNDGHLCYPEQIQEEFQRSFQLITDVYEDFNLTEYRFRLSLRDPQDTYKYFDNDEIGKCPNHASCSP